METLKQTLCKNEYINQVPLDVLVSVCLTTYNQEGYIRQALDSILIQQTDFAYEICVGEDDSTDRTRAICIEYVEKHPDRIRLFLRKKEDKIFINSIMTGRFNGLETLCACRGKYIAMLEGDDYWTDPLKLQKQVELMESDPLISLAGHNSKVVEDDGVTVTGDYCKFQPQIWETGQQVGAYHFHTGSYMMRRDLVEMWISSGAMHVYNGDSAMYWLASTLGKIAYIGDFMSVKRVQAEGISSRFLSDEKTATIRHRFLLETIRTCHLCFGLEWRAALRRREFKQIRVLLRRSRLLRQPIWFLRSVAYLLRWVVRL
jgi:glycosyltransferase involved in cell wall biosynthesis